MGGDGPASGPLPLLRLLWAVLLLLSRRTAVWRSGLSFCSPTVTLGKPLSYPGPQFPPLSTGIALDTSQNSASKMQEMSCLPSQKLLLFKFVVVGYSLSRVRLFCDPMDFSSPGSSVHGIFPGKNTGVGCRLSICFHHKNLFGDVWKVKKSLNEKSGMTVILLLGFQILVVLFLIPLPSAQPELTCQGQWQ